MGEWRKVTVDSIKAKTDNAMSTGPFGSSIGSAHFRDQGIPVLRGSNLSEDVEVRLQDDDIVFLDPCKAEEFSRSTAIKGDLIFTCWGTVGQVGLIDENARYPKYIISNKQMKLTADPDLVDSKFLYYLFSNPTTIDNIKGNAIGSSVPGFNLGQLKSMEICIPSLSEQKAVVSVIDSIEDKIKFYKKQNVLLEAMAVARFKIWQSSVAEVSKLVSLLDVINLVGGGTPKTDIDSYWNGDIPWISGKDTTPNNKGFLLATEKSITHEGLENSSAKVLPKYSVIISARGTVGNYSILGEDMAFSQSNYGIIPKIDGCHFFAYLAIAHCVDSLKSSAYGAVFDTITTETFRQQELITPCDQDIKQFNVEVSVFFEKMLENSKHIQRLVQLRDALLPKLMNGDVQLAGD